MLESHAPDVGSAFCVAALRYEVDVTPVRAPHGTEVVGGMIGELRETRTVKPADKEVGVPERHAGSLDVAVADEKHPLAVGRDRGRGEAPLGVGEQALFHAGPIVHFPQLAAAFTVLAYAEERRLAGQRAGIHACGVAGQEVVGGTEGPDARAIGFGARKEDVLHVGSVDGRIVLVSGGNLTADVAAACVGLENLIVLAARFRETDVLAVGGIGEIEHRAAIGALGGAALTRQVLYKYVGRVVTIGQIGDFTASGRNSQYAVGQPCDSGPRAPHLGHTDVVARLRHLDEIGAGLLGDGHDGVIHVLRRGGKAGGGEQRKTKYAQRTRGSHFAKYRSHLHFFTFTLFENSRRPRVRTLRPTVILCKEMKILCIKM